MTHEFPFITPDDLEDANTRSVWSQYVLVISLDRVQPFLGEIGLEAQVIAKSYPAIREFVREHERWMQVEDDAPVGWEFANQLNRMLNRIEHDAGSGAVAMLRAFVARGVAVERTEPWRRIWRILLCRLARLYRAESLIDVYAIPPDTMRNLFSIATTFADRDDSIDERVEAADAKPLADWDAEAYAYYRRESGEVLSPLDYLNSIIKESFFDETWASVVTLLTLDELEALNQWGQADVTVNMRSVSPANADLPPSARVQS